VVKTEKNGSVLVKMENELFFFLGAHLRYEAATIDGHGDMNSGRVTVVPVVSVSFPPLCSSYWIVISLVS